MASTPSTTLPRYDRSRSYEWNYANVPAPVSLHVPDVPGTWTFCGLPVGSPLGMAAGPLLNGDWCLYYASLGFDVLTYKTVRTSARPCYPLPNLLPVACGQLMGGETSVPEAVEMNGSWAVSFGMPSKTPQIWRDDIERTRRLLAREKILSVSVVGTVQPDWTIEDLADDYATAARWARESGADCIEANFSCPNVATADGQLYQHPTDAAVVAAALHEACGDLPLIIKVGHLAEPALAESLITALQPHIAALSMTNCIAVQVRGKSGELLFDGQRRGISGAATLAASVAQTAMVDRIRQQLAPSLQLIGVGGARSYEDVQQYLRAGAQAVHFATAPMVQPDVAIEICRSWPEE